VNKFLKIAIAYLCSSLLAYADFSDDQYPQRPDILPRLIAAAEAHGSPFTSATKENYVYYLRNAEYIGSCEAPFGRVHAAQFFYIRSGHKGSQTPPARGHTFVLFFDRDFHLRGYWDLDLPLVGLAFEGTKFLYGKEVIMDFAPPPRMGTVGLDGNVYSAPTWAPSSKLTPHRSRR